jgi:hypothetical protein
MKIDAVCRSNLNLGRMRRGGRQPVIHNTALWKLMQRCGSALNLAASMFRKAAWREEVEVLQKVAGARHPHGSMSVSSSVAWRHITAGMWSSHAARTQEKPRRSTKARIHWKEPWSGANGCHVGAEQKVHAHKPNSHWTSSYYLWLPLHRPPHVAFWCDGGWMMNRGGFLHQHEIVHGDGNCLIFYHPCWCLSFFFALLRCYCSLFSTQGGEEGENEGREEIWVGKAHRGQWRRSHWIDIYGERLHVG